MRRRRLALRQIEETTQDVSDIEDSDDGGGDSGGAMQQLTQHAEEPNFSLFTTTTAATAGGDPKNRAAVSTTAILLSDEEDEEMTLVALSSGKEARDARTARDGKKTKSVRSGDSPSVFQLYQEGLTPDQILQLAFTRRRAPRSLQKKGVAVGDEFVLPRPTLLVADVLPPPVDLDLRDLFATVQQSSPRSSRLPPAAKHGASSPPSDTAKLVANAKTFFFAPEDATLEERKSWRALSERDWDRVYRELQKDALQPRRSKLKPSRRAKEVPSVAAVSILLRDCQSNALACFVWETLLVALLAESCANASSSDEDHRQHQLRHIQELFRVLLHHDSFRCMTPKDFRAKVRAKNFREAVNDDAFGAQVELQLLTLYHQIRQQQR